MKRKFKTVEDYDLTIDQLQDEINVLRGRAEAARDAGHQQMREATFFEDKEKAQELFDEADRYDKRADRRVRKSKKLGEEKAKFLTIPLPFSS